MFYPDLGTKCQVGSHPNLRAVGWLSADQSYSTGKVSEDALRKMADHVYSAWQPVLAAGSHECELCLERQKALDSLRVRLEHRTLILRESPKGSYRQSRNVWIPSETVVYVAPGMIVHYIAEHGYCPPEEFVNAVQDCPAQGSEAFFVRMENALGKNYGLTPR
jgi:hypothetical protein